MRTALTVKVGFEAHKRKRGDPDWTSGSPLQIFES
jgi:hypothetical protein